MSKRVEKAPAIFFYVKDWLSSADVMSCSDAAQGVWFRMLCYMHLSDDKKLPGELGALANLLGRSPEYLRPLIAELENRKVFSRDAASKIFNRRLASASTLLAKRQQAGRLGGQKKAANARGSEAEAEDEASKTEAKASPPDPTPDPSTLSSKLDRESALANPSKDEPPAEPPNPPEKHPADPRYFDLSDQDIGSGRFRVTTSRFIWLYEQELKDAHRQFMAAGLTLEDWRDALKLCDVSMEQKRHMKELKGGLAYKYLISHLLRDAIDKKTKQNRLATTPTPPRSNVPRAPRAPRADASPQRAGAVLQKIGEVLKAKPGE